MIYFYISVFKRPTSKGREGKGRKRKGWKERPGEGQREWEGR